jgi:hypothetical protein
MKEHHGIKIDPIFARSRHTKEQNGYTLSSVPRFARNEHLRTYLYINQGCGSGSGSVLDPYSIGSVDPDPDP